MSLQVTLERGLYASGETIRGKFVVDLKEKQKIRAVRVRLKGVEKAETTMTTEHKEKIVEEVKTVFGHQKDAKKKDDIFLEAGHHEYPFDFVLPPIAPSTFHQVAIALEKDQSKIKYYVKGVLDIPMGIDKKAKATFTVHHHTDPKLLSENMDPREFSETEKMNSGFLGRIAGNGSVKLSAHFPKCCFAVGEKFKFKVSLENKSGRELKKVEAQLHRVIDIQHKQRVDRYQGEMDPTYQKVVCVAHATKNESVVADNLEYQIPGSRSLKYLSTGGSTQHIYIDYSMYVTAHFDGIGGEVRLKVPLIIHDTCCIQAGIAAGVLKGAPVAPGPVAPAVQDPMQTLTNTMAGASLQTFSPNQQQLPTMPVLYPGLMYNPNDPAMQSLSSVSGPQTHANSQQTQGSMQTLTNTMAPTASMQTMQPMPMMYNPQMMMYPHPQMQHAASMQTLTSTQHPQLQHTGSMQTLTSTQHPQLQHTGSMQTLTSTQQPQMQTLTATQNNGAPNADANMQTFQGTMQPNAMASMQTYSPQQGYPPQMMMYPQGMYPAQPGMMPYGQYPMMYNPQQGYPPGMMPMPMYMQPQQQQQPAAPGTPPPQKPPASPQPKK